MAGVFDVGDARFASEFFGGYIVVFGDFVDDLLGGGGAELGGFGDRDGAVFDEFERGHTADFGHEENGGEFALEVADVGGDVFGDVFDGFGLDFGTHKVGFGAENSAFIFEFGELEIEGASPGEP